MVAGMPSKNSPRFKRPPSPYSVSQSPRTPNSKKVWRPLNGTGNSSPGNSFADSARESWLRSLRQGYDPKSGRMNLSSSASSKYLTDQFGLAQSKKQKLSNSVGDLSAAGKPCYKSQEDMYDEIMSLKKSASLNKVEYDSLKAKLRRAEEENARKEKYIEQLLDVKMSDESIQKLAEGKSRSGSSTTARLKQRILKLEKQLRDKEKEYEVIKSDIKVTDIQEMKTALQVYHQEVMRLREISMSQQHEIDRANSSLNSEMEMTPRKVRMLRKNVLQLTAENNRLAEENQTLRRDLEQVIGEASDLYDEDDGINYGALSKPELVSIIKKLKHSIQEHDGASKSYHDSEKERLKKLVEKLKEQKNELRVENDELRAQNDCRLRDLDELRDEHKDLRSKMRDQRRSSTTSNSHSTTGRRRSVHDSARNPVRQNNAALSIQKQWRKHKMKQKEKDDDVVLLQSAFRAHNLRQKQIKGDGHERTVDERYISDADDYLSEDSDEIVLLQSALRGHMERVDRGH